MVFQPVFAPRKLVFTNHAESSGPLPGTAAPAGQTRRSTAPPCMPEQTPPIDGIARACRGGPRRSPVPPCLPGRTPPIASTAVPAGAHPGDGRASSATSNSVRSRAKGAGKGAGAGEGACGCGCGWLRGRVPGQGPGVALRRPPPVHPGPAHTANPIRIQIID
jgi:hypothetical protein